MPISRTQTYQASGYPGVRHRQEEVEAYYPSDQEQEYLALMAERYNTEERDTHKYPFERQWFMNAAFYEGYQNVVWSDTKHRLEEKPTPPWRRRFVANWIFPAVQRAVSMVLANKPRPSVAPATGDMDDRRKAQLSEKVFSGFADRVKFDRKLRKAMNLACITGTSFMKPFWNSRLGDRTEDGGFEGDVDLEILNPFNIFVDPFAESVEKAQWIVQSTIKPLDVIRNTYPEFGKYVHPEKSANLHGWFERRLLSLAGASGHTTTLESREYEEAATVVEMWQRPSPEHPQGLHIIMASNVILNPSRGKGRFDNPYVGLDKTRRLELPFFPVLWAQPVHRFWGVSLVEQLIPIQRELNAKKSQIIENINVTSRPKWRVPKGNSIPKSGFTSEPGEIIEYNATLPPPEPMTPPPLPEYVQSFHEQLVRDFQIVSAQSDVTQARAPGSVRTGVAIELLQQKDESVYAPIRHELWDTVSDVARACLLLMQELYREERTSKLLGPNHEWEVFSFTGTDLAGATDIRFLLDTGLGETRQAKMASLDDMIQRGVINIMDPQERMKVLKLFESSALDEFYREHTVAQEEAERELRLVVEEVESMGPVQIVAEPWQDHQIHFSVKNAYRMTPAYRKLDPLRKQILDQNCEQHQQFMEQARQQMLMEQQAMQGSAGQKGTPSPPRPPATGAQVTAAHQEGGMMS